MWKNVLNFQSGICFYIPYIISFFYFCMLQFTDRFSSLNHQAYWKKKNIRSKCYFTISNFLKKIVWLLSFWIEYGNNYQLFFFPESKFIVYLCNLRWHHNRFQTSRRCYGGIFNFPTWKTREIDLLGTCYIHADFETCTICRTPELELPIPIFYTTVTNYILNCHINKYQ